MRLLEYDGIAMPVSIKANLLEWKVNIAYA